MYEPDFTPNEEATTVSPWRPGHPRAEVTVYPTGREPLLWIYTHAKWRYAVVEARHRYPFGTAYQVSIKLSPPEARWNRNLSGVYRWDTPAVQVCPRKLTDEQAREWARIWQEEADRQPGQ